jgi:hypothetical protein
MVDAGRLKMNHHVVEPADDIMPASFAYGLLASLVVGVALWCLAVYLLV